MTIPAEAVAKAIGERGFAICPRVLGEELCDRLSAALASAPATRRRREAGSRSPFAALERLRVARTLEGLLTPLLGPGAFVVRALVFDKNVKANWAVPWHRDRLIAVTQRREVPGFSAWSMKDGVPHTQPPRALLVRMLAVRLHLDAADAANAPLRIIPGSHLDGDADTEDDARGRTAETCAAPRGSALLMRPLLLHASSRAERVGHRRVLHLECANEDLPGGLHWRWRELIA